MVAFLDAFVDIGKVGAEARDGFQDGGSVAGENGSDFNSRRAGAGAGE